MTALSLNHYLNVNHTNFLSYENNFCGFKVNYPAGWKYEELNDPITHEAVLFLPYDLQEPTKLTVICEHLKNAMSLTEYVDAVTQQKREAYSDLKILTAKEVTFANNRGYELVYSAKDIKDANSKWKFKQVISLRREYAYSIVYKANVADFSKYEKSASQIADSLQVLEK